MSQPIMLTEPLPIRNWKLTEPPSCMFKKQIDHFSLGLNARDPDIDNGSHSHDHIGMETRLWRSTQSTLKDTIVVAWANMLSHAIKRQPKISGSWSRSRLTTRMPS